MLEYVKDPGYADSLRSMIDDNAAHEGNYNSPDDEEEENNVEDLSVSEGGTHVSVLGPDGSAVSASSSLGSLCVLNLTTSEHSVSPQLIALLLTGDHSIKDRRTREHLLQLL